MQQKEQKCFSAKRPARLPFFRRILYLKFPVKQYSHAGSRRYTFLTESQDVYFVYPECSNVASIVPCALWKDTRAIPCKCKDYHGKIKLWAQEQKMFTHGFHSCFTEFNFSSRMMKKIALFMHQVYGVLLQTCHIHNAGFFLMMYSPKHFQIYTLCVHSLSSLVHVTFCGGL